MVDPLIIIKSNNLFERGKKNSISDVNGVKVGHYTLDTPDHKTGITSIIPHSGNTFKNKLLAASHIINGFGKSVGLVQIDELGTLETPILLTNTFAIGTCLNALTKEILRENPDIGDTTGTVNSVVAECNDGVLNHIRKMSLTESNAIRALHNASSDFIQGGIGAGRGMVCYGLKGGIGSSSRLLNLYNKTYTLGLLVLSNFGSTENLNVYGSNIGKKIKKKLDIAGDNKDKGSIILVLATDIPLSSSQLKRVLKRTQSGIARTGGYTGNGSGEIAIGFSTANTINHYPSATTINIETIHDDLLDPVFSATVEATEEAIINSLMFSNTSVGRNNKTIYSLNNFIKIQD